MRFRTKLAVAVLSLCGGGVATGTVIYAARPQQNTTVPETTPTPPNMTLKNVQIFFRHGARTPLVNIKSMGEAVFDKNFFMKMVPHTDIPYTVEYLYGGPKPSSVLQGRYNKVVFKGGMTGGVLTTVGQEQAYILGRRLGERYCNNLKLVGDGFDKKEIHVQSTNMDRTIESLRCVIAGMFGGAFAFRKSSPVVIRVNQLTEEVLFPTSHKCDIFAKLETELEVAYLFTPQFIDLVNQIQQYTGDLSALDDINMMQIRDQIVAREVHGQYVPPFLDRLRDRICQSAVDTLQLCVCGYIPERLAGCCKEVCDDDCVEQARVIGLSFAVGRLLHSVAETLQSAAHTDRLAGSDDHVPKMYLYSCHDSTVASILLALGCYDNEWPPYMADVAFELYEDRDGKHWVMTRYCAKDMLVRGQELPLVPLDKFLGVIEPYIITAEQRAANCQSMPAATKILEALSKKVPVTEETHIPEVL